MKSILPLRAIPAASSPPPFFSILCFPLLPRLKHRSSFGTRLRAHSLPLNTNSYPSQDSQNNQQPRRTLYPGGYKRPEIKVPNLVLQLDVEEVLRGGNVLDLIDKAVAKSVGIVVLNSAQGGSGGKLYEAACLLKSVVKDRAYFLIAERVDIAAAVNASGVVLSDQAV
ncbi:probable transmembrane GTPase FZO-like, chloroplastic isoform X2 [Carica papaya]|uniref:probable transmembrane GTPase FZO-like, chloroplastic isoform X2 n=1 Tax=Carica papaya TaxID=3649 RepID=UPI000B8CB9DB|nr:probable transmembrane GTPase FZO-like, chloroplastic isoform X2 [Carica papaya]